MSKPLFTNNAATALAVAITPTDTVLQVVAGTSSYFPTPTGGDYFMLTLIQINNPEVAEIVKCTSKTGDYLTVVRGQEGTQPQIFNISDNVQLRITASSLNLFSGDNIAANINFTPYSFVTATNVQSAIDQTIDGVNSNSASISSLESSTGSSLIGYTEGASGTVATTVQAKFQEVLSVKDFGATGDGTTDDTSAIQAALNALYTAATVNLQYGATLYFPKGVYKCGALTFNPPNTATRFGRITIRGDKGSSIILSTVTTGQVAFNVGVYAGMNNFGGWLFEGMYFKSANFQGIGLQFSATNWSALVDNCIFLGFDYNYRNYSGITTTIQNSFFMSAGQWNYFSAPATTGITGYDEVPANFRFQNNYVGQGFNDAGTVVYSQRGIGSTNTTWGLGRGAIIQNNVFEGNIQYAIWVGSSSGTNNDNTVIDSNWFESPNYPSTIDQINGGLVRSSITNNYSSVNLLANYGSTLLPGTGLNVIYSNFKFGLGNQYGTVLPLANVSSLSVNNDGTYSPNTGEIALTGSNQAQIFTRNISATSGHYWQVGGSSSNAFVVYNQSNTGVYLTDGGTSWTANSDETLKTDLIPIADAVSKVNSLRSVTGRYKTDDESVRRAFLIAQDVKAVLPEAVNTQADGILGLQYSDVIPLLVAAIKEQSEQITTLQQQVTALTAK